MADAAFRAPREPVVSPGAMDVYARDMTVSIAADVSLDEVQRRLAEAGQWLPIDGDPALSIGQLVAENSTGPLRLGYGAWRDLLLGCQFTNGRGELISAGGRVVKNVAGYDLTKLMVGQRGLFGKIVTITTRTYRRPVAFLAATFEPDEAHLRKLLPTACRPQWALLDEASLVCGYVGDEAMIAFVQSALPRWEPRAIGDSESWDQDRLRRAEFWKVFDGVPFRAAVPPARIREFVAAAHCTQWVADPAFGIVRASCSVDGWPAVAAAAKQVGGAARREGPLGTEDVDSISERNVVARLVGAFGGSPSPVLGFPRSAAQSAGGDPPGSENF